MLLQDAIRTADEDIQAYFMTDVFPRLGRVRTVDEAIALLDAAR